MSEHLPPQFPGLDLSITVAPGFPSVHEAYRRLSDQKDMVCGAYALTYLLWSYGIGEYENEPLTVDRVAALAGTGLEAQNQRRQQLITERVESGDVPPERAEQWYPHEYFTEQLATVETGGTSPQGVVRACTEASGGLVEAIPVPAIADGTVQLTAEVFETLLDSVLGGDVPAQLILNYNLRHTLAPASLLGHKYNLVALFTQWDDPDYFRRLDWDVGHFTSVAARLARTESERRYLLIRDSYKTFGWNGYHLQPESAVRRGIVREEDHRDGGLFLVTPSAASSSIESLLDELDLQRGTWDNGSEFAPVECDP